jgi:adenosine 3'-phospho 5'-phosphosulfate transporter B2
VLLLSGQLLPAIEFCFAYPALFYNSIALSFAAMMGQVVIYYSIKNFGALFFATVMTTRQVFSILLSCLLYFHPLSFGQWVGSAVVFGALYYQGFVKKSRGGSKH